MARPEEVRHVVSGAADWKKKENPKKCMCQALSLVWSETLLDKVWHDG
jgi:hypothetical protein